MRNRYAFLRWLNLVAFVVTLFPHPASAQQVSLQEIELPPGAIFEIITETPSPTTSVNWVLTREGAFLESSRTVVFNTRFTEAGTYLLNGEVSDTTSGTVERIVLTLNVKENAPFTIPPSASDDTLLVNTLPPAASDGLIGIADQRVIRLDPARSDIEQFIIDLDLNRDASGDGDPVNDNIVSGTIFRTGGTSAYLWLRRTPQVRTMVVGAQLSIGRILTQKFRLHAGIAAGSMEQELEAPSGTGNGEIAVRIIEEQNYAFAVQFAPGQEPDTPVLYHWDFGDGKQSMLDQPEHLFGPGTTYTVEVTVRDLASGKEQLRAEKSVVVPAVAAPPSKEPPVTPPLEEPREESSLSIGWILKIVAVLIIAMLFGIGGMAIFAKFKGASLEKAMERAESKIVGEKPTDVIESTKPMALAGQDDEDEEDTPPPSKAQTSAPLPTELVAAPAPAWLSGTAQEKKSADQPSSPAPPQPEESAALPSWMQPETSAPPPSPPEEATPAAPSVGPPKATSDLPPRLAKGEQPSTVTAPSPPAAAPQEPVKEDLPPWLSSTTSPPSPSATPAVPVQANAAPSVAPQTETPPWLQKTDVPAPTVEPAPSAPPPPTSNPPSSPALTATATVQASPSSATTGSGGSTGTAQAATTQTTSTAKTEEQLERERERKRLKRQRYRKNKKDRKGEDAPSPATGTTVATAPIPAANEAPEPVPALSQEPTPQHSPAPVATPPTPIPSVPPAENAQNQLPPWLQNQSGNASEFSNILTPVSAPSTPAMQPPASPANSAAGNPPSTPVPAQPVPVPPPQNIVALSTTPSSPGETENDHEVRFIVSADNLNGVAAPKPPTQEQPPSA